MLSVSFAISVQTDFAAAPYRRATATLNGPYGAVSLFDQFDAMILIAGGSDAVWAFVIRMVSSPAVLKQELGLSRW
jgi:hypothetical protein